MESYFALTLHAVLVCYAAELQASGSRSLLLDPKESELGWETTWNYDEQLSQ